MITLVEKWTLDGELTEQTLRFSCTGYFKNWSGEIEKWEYGQAKVIILIVLFLNFYLN